MAYAQGQGYSGTGTGPRTGFWRRFAAALIDSIILGIVNGILVAALKGAGYALGFIIGIAYYVYFEGGPTGQTLGGRVMGVRVISLEDGASIGYGRAFIRYIGRIVSAIPILLGYFWMLWDSENQCWHDKFAGSIVVPVDAYPPPS